MIKLYIGSQPAIDSTTFDYSALALADLNQDENVTLTTQINDFEAISGQTAPYTLQFTIPCSDKNNSKLLQYSQIDASSSINPHRGIQAMLVMGDMIEIIGSLEVKGYSWEDGKPKDYKVVFYGQEFSMKTLLSKQLNQIDWSAYDYALTNANMKSSWDLGLNDGNVLLPVMSHVRDYLYQPTVSQGQNHPNNIANNTAYYEEGDDEMENPLYPGIKLDELKTAIKLQAMIETIYDDIGVSITWGTTIADYLSNVFVIPSKDAGKAKNETVQQDGFTMVTKYDSETTYQYLQTTYTTINMPTEVIDIADLWDGTNIFTAPVNGWYQFELTYNEVDSKSCNKGTSYEASEVQFRAYQNSTTQWGNESAVFACWMLPRVQFAGYLNATDTLVFQGKSISGSFIVGYKNYQLTLISSPTTFYDQTTSIGDNMPEMSAYDFIRGFMATFNLMQVIELTEKSADLGVQTIKIVDKDEFYTGGTLRDWTKYVSTGKRVYDKPLIDKDLVLKYAEYKDKVNIAFFREALRNYAQLNYLSDADFEGKDMDVNSIFSVFPPSFLTLLNGFGGENGSTNLLMHSQFDNEGKPINSNFLMFMYNGKYKVSPYYIQTGVDSAGVATFSGTETDYPYCTTHEYYPSQASSYALNFGVETPANTDMTTAALNTASKTFFFNYLKNLYGSQAKILTVDALLPIKELNDFKLNDTIEIQGIRYVVDTMKRDLLKGITKLKLFTYNADVPYTKPNGYANGGSITFDDTPTEKELTTFNARVNNKSNLAGGTIYLWKDYRTRIKPEALVTQDFRDEKLKTKAEGYAVATSKAFTISTSITNTLTIYDTINTKNKVWFNGEPTVPVTHTAVPVTHSGVIILYSASFPGRITVYEAGTYQFSTSINFSLATLPQNVKLILAVNGVNYFKNPLISADTTTAWDITLNTTVPLDVGDYVNLYIYGDISQAYTLNSATTKINRI